MNNVIQLADVRRAKLDKIAAQQTAKGVELCLFLTSSYTPKTKPRILEAILEDWEVGMRHVAFPPEGGADRIDIDLAAAHLVVLEYLDHALQPRVLDHPGSLKTGRSEREQRKRQDVRGVPVDIRDRAHVKPCTRYFRIVHAPPNPAAHRIAI